MRRSVLNYLAPASLVLSIVGFLLILLGALCISGLILHPTVGAICGIIALVCSSVSLALTGVARWEIVQNAQSGDGIAVSAMVVAIVVCALSIAALVVYFVLYT